MIDSMDSDYDSLYKIIEKSPNLVIHLKPPIRVGTVSFHLLWLVGWLFGEIYTINLALNSNLSSNLLLWLVGWTFGGLSGLVIVGWQLSGIEIVTIDDFYLIIERKLFFLSSSRKFKVSKIANIRTDFTTPGFFDTNARRREADGMLGKIKFDYGWSTKDFGAGLNEWAANTILTLIKERLFLPK